MSESNKSPVCQHDREILKQIEKELETPLKELGPEHFKGESREKRFTIGYLPGENERIIGISLNNQTIPDLSHISRLDGLQKLILWNTRLKDISFVKKLTGLTYLNVWGNQLTDVSFLSQLKSLTSLDLSNNLLVDVSYLRELKELSRLFLSNNPLRDISFVKELSGLTVLGLSNLTLGDNGIKCLLDLKKLKNLYLSYNQISDASCLRELHDLERLWLRNNNLTDISFLKDLEKLERINLNGNPLAIPPWEIIQEGPESIRNYFKAMEGKKRSLKEVKVLLVGDGGAGKTSLLKKLHGDDFDPEEPQTHGINIRDLPTTMTKDARIHVWDFGGQDIMHATHQFFLSRRSLYILVTDSRRNDNVEHWLKHIRSFGGDSPVMVVINKIDQTPSFDLNRLDLQQKYPNICGFYKLSCASCKGVESFTTELMARIQSLEYMKTEWPKSWFDVKTELEKMKRSYINMEHYQNICRAKKVTDDSERQTLLEYLHNLGIILHFDRFDLQEYQVLEPRWITEAVYKIINSKTLANNRGYLKKEQLDHILHKEVFDNGTFQSTLKRNKYTAMEQYYLLCLMKEFKLCYYLDDNTVLVPDLLKVEMPPEVAQFATGHPLSLVYRFDFLPPAVLPRFIVAMHTDISSPGYQWRSGVILENEKLRTRALVTADREAREIRVRITGEPSQRRDYMTLIRYQLDTILDSFQQIQTTRWVPLPDKKQPGDIDMLVEFEELLGYRHRGRDEYFSGILDKIYSVSTLLEGIETDDLLRFHPHEDRGYRFDKLEITNIVDVAASAHADAHAEVTSENIMNVYNLTIDLQGEFERLKPLLLETFPNLASQLEDLDRAVYDVKPDRSPEELNRPLSKLGHFLKRLGDKNTDEAKILEGSGRVLQIAKHFGRIYNKIAGFLPITLPKVPDFLLGK